MRPSYEQPADRSATPIYDSLYAEYRRLFRALPGDRSGEEDLRFEAFGTSRTTGVAHWGDPVGRRRRVGGPAALPPGRRDAGAQGR